MYHRPHIQRYTSRGYDPWETRIDRRVRCNVCGFAGIDPETWQEPDKALFAISQSGDTYAPDAGSTVEEIAANVDVLTETQYATRAGCPFCGSPRWADGSAPGLKW